MGTLAIKVTMVGVIKSWNLISRVKTALLAASVTVGASVYHTVSSATKAFVEWPGEKVIVFFLLLVICMSHFSHAVFHFCL